MGEFRPGFVKGFLGKPALSNILNRSDVQPPPPRVEGLARNGVELLDRTVRHQEAHLVVVIFAYGSGFFYLFQKNMTVFWVNATVNLLHSHWRIRGKPVDPKGPF